MTFSLKSATTFVAVNAVAGFEEPGAVVAVAPLAVSWVAPGFPPAEVASDSTACSEDVVGDTPPSGLVTTGALGALSGAVDAVWPSLSASVCVGVVSADGDEIWPSVAIWVSESDVGEADVAAPPGEAVFGPPLLLTVTPGATSEVEDVVPDDAVDAPPEEVAWLPVTEEFDDADGADVDTAASPVVSAASVTPLPVAPTLVAPADEAAPAVEAPGVVEDELDVSALANPGEVTTITPIPRAAANAPTRPMYRL